MWLAWPVMKLRLPQRPRFLRPRLGELPPLGITDRGGAFRILDPPDEIASVRRVPTGAPPRPADVRRPPPPPMEAGYRWGMAAARTACEPAVDDERERAGDAGPVEVVPAWTGDHLPAVRFERAVLAVAARTEVLGAALERLRDRLDELDDRFVDVVTHEDLVEIESRRARLAAEVSRVSVELKAEMDRRLSEVARALAHPGRRAPSVDHRGTLDLADAKRVEIHLDHLEEASALADLEARRTA